MRYEVHLVSFSPRRLFRVMPNDKAQPAQAPLHAPCADAATGRRLERSVGEILPFLSDRQINAAIRLAFLRYRSFFFSKL